MRRITGFVLCAALTTACPSARSEANEPASGAAAMLVSYRHTMTMQPGTGGTSTLTTVRRDGTVEREQATESASTAVRCPALPAENLAELEALVQAARDAGLRPAYTTSTLPTPNANYSVDLWFILGGGNEIEVQVAGFADMPPELSALAQWLEANVTGCESQAEGGPTEPVEPTEPAGEEAEACVLRDPGLVDIDGTVAADFAPTASSPAVNAGTVIAGDTLDYLNRPIPDPSGRADIGAFEYQ